MLKNLKMVLALFSPRERRQVYWMLPAMMAMGLIQVAGVASILPFLSLVTDPKTIETSKYLKWIYETLKFTDARSFLLAAGISTIVLLTFSNAFSAVTMWFLYRFSYMQNNSLSIRLLEKYLHQPYVYFLNQNSTGLSTTILSEVQQVVINVIVPWMQMLANLITTVLILALLIASQPLLALFTIFFLGGTFVGIFVLIRRKLSSTGKERFIANKQRYKIASEAFGGIKELKLSNKEATFIHQFSIPSGQFASTQAISTILGQLPLYAIETISFDAILILILVLLGSGNNITELLPMIGLYAFAAYRLLPALQYIFSTVTRLRFYQPALESLYAELVTSEHKELPKIPSQEPSSVMPFKNELVLRDLTFYYPETGAPIFENLNLVIKPNTSIAFIGPTGAGKTTLVDVILGLLQPSNGQVLVDGVPLTLENTSRWQKNLGYVPQNIFLTDDTLANNIAFGVPYEQVNMDAVIQAAKIANLHEFIQELPDKYSTVVGERGVRLSGGQRQRVGIARALYHNPDVIIFDEATNALDSITEDIVFSAIAEISKLKTIIIIAHRLSTVRDCDEIYLLDEGKIVAQGNYKMLLDTNAQFRAMAKEGSADHK